MPFPAVPYIVVEDERPKIFPQSSSSFEISEITDKIDASKSQFLPVVEVIGATGRRLIFKMWAYIISK